MGTVIPQTTYEVFEAGMYRATVGAAAMEESEFGPQVAVRFDLTEPGYEGKTLRAWASAKLTGGKRPSKLYSWTSALFFGGRPLPEGFDLDTDTLIGRAALVVLDVVQKDGMERNRVAQLLPLKPARSAPAPAPAATPADRAVLRPRSVVTAGVSVGAGNDPNDVPGWMTDDGEEGLPF